MEGGREGNIAHSTGDLMTVSRPRLEFIKG